MKKALLAAALLTHFTTQLFAGGDIAPLEEIPEAEVHAHHTESKYYIVLAGMMLLGDEINHGEALLDGNNDFGYGIGIDVGYRLGNGFAVEYDFTYGRNTVYEIIHDNVVTEAESVYYTSALDIVYTYEFTEEVGVFGKLGYEYEWETISDLDIEEQDHGFVFGVGIEYTMNKSYKLLVEYEHSTIEGPHGDAILAGVMYNF